MNQFERLLDSLQKGYYVQVLLFVVEFFALVFAFLYSRKTKIGRFFIFYIAFDFAILIGSVYLVTNSTKTEAFANTVFNYTNTLIALVELLVYYYFFSKTLSPRWINSLMKILALLYILLIIVFTITKFSFLSPRFSYISYLLGAMEFVFLLPPCMVFFYELLNSKSELPLFKRPSFWITTGIFFFSIISIPYYLVLKYISSNKKELTDILAAVFYYLPFTINFVFLCKAFLCKKTLTT